MRVPVAPAIADVAADVEARPVADGGHHRRSLGVGPRAEIGGKRGRGADAGENSCQNDLFHVNPDDVLAAFGSDGPEPGLCFSNHARRKTRWRFVWYKRATPARRTILRSEQ